MEPEEQNQSEPTQSVLPTEQSVTQVEEAANRTEPGAHLQGVFSVLVAATLLSLLLRRFGRSGSAGNLRRWMPLLHSSVWFLAVIAVTMIYARGLPSSWFLAIWLLFLIVAFAGVGWLRSVLAGVALSVEGRIRVGDSIRVEDVSGEVLAFGVRSVRLRGPDGAIHELPNEKLVTESVANLTGERGDSACELQVTVPESIDAEDALDIARSVAVLSPLASPRHRPEVFLLSRDSDNRHQIHVRGFSFDAQYQDHFRSDVVSRLQAAFAQLTNEQAGSHAPAADRLIAEE